MHYVMFLRGINVDPVKVPMAELRASLTKLGLQDVKTFLQTGNVLFASSKDIASLKPVIERALSEQFHYTAFVLLYPATVLRGIIKKYPFTTDELTHRYAIFCESQAVIDELLSYQPTLDTHIEDIAPGRHVIYWRVPKGRSTDTPFSKVIAKPEYKATTTNRNVNTLEKMVSPST
jgi:uncharacterized protein (DUF1697 family)